MSAFHEQWPFKLLNFDANIVFKASKWKRTLTWLVCVKRKKAVKITRKWDEHFTQNRSCSNIIRLCKHIWMFTGEKETGLSVIWKYFWRSVLLWASLDIYNIYECRNIYIFFFLEKKVSKINLTCSWAYTIEPDKMKNHSHETWKRYSSNYDWNDTILAEIVWPKRSNTEYQWKEWMNVRAEHKKTQRNFRFNHISRPSDR